MRWIGIVTTFLLGCVAILGGIDYVRSPEMWGWRMIIGVLSIIGGQQIGMLALNAAREEVARLFDPRGEAPK